MIKIITENTISNDIHIIDNVEDASKSEVYGTIVAYINDDLAGTIDYTLEESDKVFYIRMITTVPEYRRQRVATEMCRYIKDNYSQYNIDWGYTTSEGEQLRKKLTKDIPNEAYTKLKQKALSLQKRLDELEAIVHSGTKINIDYYLRQNIDEDKIDDIYEYFRHDASSDSVIEAMKELGSDYSEEEVRLVRIKFMSELAN